jgi:hypothetical protein
VKAWVKWSLLAAFLTLMVIIQFIPDDAGPGVPGEPVVPAE